MRARTERGWLPCGVASPDDDAHGRSGRLTINDVARITGLSKATVSRAMNDRKRVAPQTRLRVLQVLNDYGYTPARAATALSTGRTGLIGLMIGENRNPNALSVIGAAVDVAEKADCRIVVSATSSGLDHERAYKEVFASRLVDGGVLLFPPASDADVLASLVSGGLPLVAIEPERPIPGVPSVYADARRDGVVATQHLVDLGHRRIALNLDPAGWGEQDRVVSGYRSVLRAAGLPFDMALVSRLGWDFDAGFTAVSNWLRRRTCPTAVVFNCDTAALGGLAAAREAGVRVPEELSIISYDDTDVLRWTTPAITSLADRRSGLTRTGFSVLLEMLTSDEAPPPRQRVVTTLALRGSTASPAGSR